ncbi:MAG: hypothetical protein Fur0010_08480 [Bdellovibrio sp.]
MKDHFMQNIVGKSKKGHPIKMYSYGQNHLPQVLFYGLPDPGEYVGSSGILGLMRALKDPNHTIHQLPVRWNFIPLVNIDDQPDNGNTLAQVQKNPDQEIDWMIDRPRPETKMLLNINELLSPIMVFPMHDEFHSNEILPCYFPVSRNLPIQICEAMREIAKNYGLKISEDIIDPQMGQGFLNIHNVHDIGRSTFSHFIANALVFICEVPRLEEPKFQNLMAMQIATGLTLMSALISSEN